MASFFAFLFLAALGLLLWGVISPRSMSRIVKKSVTRKKAGLGFGVAALALFILTGVTAPPQQSSNAVPKAETKDVSTVQPSQNQQTPAPIITAQTVTETEAVPFESQTTESSSFAKGATKVTTPGVNGVKTRTFEVTYEDGKETNRVLIKEEVTTQPVAQVTSVGTKVAAVSTPAPAPAKPASSCSPNYSGCVPIASDVDCAGGSGDGPAYVSGPVKVIGTDIYRLDADHDGFGCE
jgi:hypothetical protein